MITFGKPTIEAENWPHSTIRARKLKTKPMRYVFVQYASCVSYEPIEFSTKREAVAYACQWIRDTRNQARYKLTQVGSFHNLDKVELRIGGRQGYHLYSSAYVHKKSYSLDYGRGTY